MTIEHENESLIDPSILDTNQEGTSPVFTTQVDQHGQVELTAEEQSYVNEDPDADMPLSLDDMVARAAAGHTDLMVSPEAIDEATEGLTNDDIALVTLDQLPTEHTLTIDEMPSQNHAVTSQGNEASSSEGAFISNAPSELEKGEGLHPEDALQLAADNAQHEALHGAGHNRPMSAEEMKREFFKDVNKFGKASGEGASALGRLGLRALRAAADGIISTAKPQGGGKDDATLIYEAYTAMDSKHSEHTAGGSKANASKLRQIIGMGCMTTLSDPVAIGDKVVRIHERMTDAELKPKAIFAALVDVAREQQGSDTEITDAAIEECLTKTKADKTIEKEWEAIYKRAEALVTGEASHGLKDTSDTAMKIVELMSEHVKNYKADGNTMDRIEQMVEMGYTQAQAVAIVDKKIAL